MVPSSDQAERNGDDEPARERPTILLVEDEILIRLNAAGELRADGMIVMEAANADEALIVLESGARVDLLLTDVRMPGSVDGLELARLVRNRWPNLKLIICSGQNISNAIDAQAADAFVLKPHDDKTLTRLVRRLLEIERDH